jgi:hypothetical protein
MEALGAVDLSNLPNKPEGITQEGLSIVMHINISKGEVLSAYPVHKGWLPGELLRKKYGKSN